MEEVRIPVEIYGLYVQQQYMVKIAGCPSGLTKKVPLVDSRRLPCSQSVRRGRC
jgi:hypothetical protein